MKKSLVIVALAAIMVMAFAQSAFALHGSFSAYGKSCSECHVVHGSEGGNLFGGFTETPLNTYGGLTAPAGFQASTTEKVCEYCHVYGGHSIQQVYGNGMSASSSTKSPMAIHEIGATTVPDAGGSTYTLKGDGAGGLGCVDCHNALPHAGKAFTAVKIDSPSKTAQSIYAQDTSINGFCSRCHASNMSTTLGGVSHILTSSTSPTMATTGFGDQQVAWLSTANCTSCHAVNEFHNLGTPNSSNATNAIDSTGTAFTNYGGGKGYGQTTYTGIADGMCLSCHQNGSGAGVGLTY